MVVADISWLRPLKNFNGCEECADAMVPAVPMILAQEDNNLYKRHAKCTEMAQIRGVVMKRFVSMCAVGVISLFAVESVQAQFTPTSPEYYAPRVASIFPALSAAHSGESVSPEVLTGNQVLGGNCCQPLIPTIAQGIRDTLQAVFPCWGVRRPHPLGSRLFISERFHHGTIMGGCGCGTPHGGVIYQGEVSSPTPVEELPATPEVDESAIRQNYLPGYTPAHLRNASVLSVPVTIEANTIRSQSPPPSITVQPATYRTITKPASSRYPANPLRD
tara:strand:- start:144 stop:968 length:825 start_codon:yes stop_codon:yes gene_type:complete